MKKFTIAATALAVAVSTISFAPAANAAPVAASAAAYGSDCATIGATAAGKGADGSDLKCLKATVGTFKGKKIWSYESLPTLKSAEIIIPNSLTSGFGGFGKAVADAMKAEGILKTDAVLTPNKQATYALTLDYMNKTLAGKAGKLGVTGFAQAAGALTSKSATMVSTGVPAARMMADYLAIAVKSDSKYTSVKQLVSDLEKAPKAMAIVGGNVGGVDNYAATSIFQNQSIDVADMNYVPTKSTVAADLLSDAKYAFGVSSYADFAPYVKAGTLRILAVTSPSKLPGVTAPTLKASGINVVVENWRGIMLPPKTPVAAQKLVIRALDVVVKSNSFKTYLASQSAFASYLPGSAWTSFLKKTESDLAKLLKKAGLI